MRYFSDTNKIQAVLFGSLSLFYLIFFFNLISDDRASWSLTYLLVLLAILCIVKFRRLYIHPSILMIGLSSFILITLNEYFFHAHQISSDQDFYKNAQKYIHQFIYIIPLVFLGTLFKFAQFSSRALQNIIFISLVFSVIYNSYLNFYTDFDRSQLIPYFKSIILYDYCLIALSLLGLVMSFQLKNKLSFLIIFIALFNIANIILHGSRGAWLGIPIALMLITLFFYRAELKKTIFMLFITFCLTIIMFYIPNSPIQSRMANLESDTALIEKNNYNSSIGTRLALWQFAFNQFKQAPLTGHGIVQFREMICAPNAQNQVPNCQPHAHNIVLQELASHGILGLINLLFIASITFWFFIKNFKKTQQQSIKVLAFSGIIICIYFIICGISDFLFYFSFPTMFIFLILLTLMNIIYIENKPLTLNNSNIP